MDVKSGNGAYRGLARISLECVNELRSFCEVAWMVAKYYLCLSRKVSPCPAGPGSLHADIVHSRSFRRPHGGVLMDAER